MEDRAALSAEVNRLYWDTEDSVADISNKLGVSRRALYELIEPMATGVDCTGCGAELYFSNRSARAGATARCLVCGAERSVDDVARTEPAIVPPYFPQPAGARNRFALIAAFTVAGLVVGSIAALIIKRKR